MKSPAIVVIAFSLIFGVAGSLFGQPTQTQSTQNEVLQIVAKSQEALRGHDEQRALSLIKDGLIKFPNDENLQIQLARIYVEQKQDRQAIGLLNAILLANPDSRNAKLELAEIYGYRENYRQ
ncbi:MAG TPA: tetratricopeptide repeat protein, partial [Candidatus Angelobacter sp.]|nr:tetratricopeptide repeat protein [Candidatus Angelobacter sp.]